MTAAMAASSYYPMDEDGEGERVRTNVRLRREQHEDIELMASLWNELDRALGRSRPRKWKGNSVMERLIEVGIEGFWLSVGGRPSTKEDRAVYLARAIERLGKPKK